MANSGDWTERYESGTVPGSALLIAAAPVGKGRLMDAAEVLPALAAVPPGVLVGTAAASVVELVDPADPQVILTRLRTAAASPGPLLIHLIGQLTLDRKQRLPHLALARTTPVTVRYTGFPWHWLAAELAHRALGSTAVFADLVAEAGAWQRLRAEPGLLLMGLPLYGTVSPPPDRRAVSSPVYSRAVSEVLRPASARPAPAELHRRAVTLAGMHPEAWDLAGTGVAEGVVSGIAPVGPDIAPDLAPGLAVTGASAGPGSAPGRICQGQAGPGPAGPDRIGPGHGHGFGRPGHDAVGQAPGATELATGSPGSPSPARDATAAPPQTAPSSRYTTSPYTTSPYTTSPDTTSPDTTSPDTTSPETTREARSPRPQRMPGRIMESRSAGPPQSAPPAPPQSAPAGGAAAAHQHPPAPPTPPAYTPAHHPYPCPQEPAPAGQQAVPAQRGGAVPRRDAVPPRPEAVPDPHPAILAAAREGRHGEAAAMAAAWEQQALRTHGATSAEALHWLEVRADLARLAADYARSCELWTAAASARLGRGEPADAPDLVAAVDRAHHCWEQLGDGAVALALAEHLAEVRRRVPGRRPGAVDALNRRVDALNTTGTG
ncbi:hypothetical protein [Streptomyces sp. NPDC051776]|uniref:hypothetical protein n=1 Tax=Streptomyces sp. NPDC051776 TaxID=3155414 RepID=UPI0034313D5C